MAQHKTNDNRIAPKNAATPSSELLKSDSKTLSQPGKLWNKTLSFNRQNYLAHNLNIECQLALICNYSQQFQSLLVVRQDSQLFCKQCHLILFGQSVFSELHIVDGLDSVYIHSSKSPFMISQSTHCLGPLCPWQCFDNAYTDTVRC